MHGPIKGAARGLNPIVPGGMAPAIPPGLELEQGRRGYGSIMYSPEDDFTF